MKPVQDFSHVGTLEAEGRINMEFDKGSISHLMSILIDLYSDPELAVIREYSTNGWDAMIEAGTDDRPLEITLPSELMQEFRVKDYGTGMSVDTVIDVYSKYGASTKRNTNSQAGMLGLGSKSGLTYTTQFTVIAVREGIKAIVLVTRNPDGSGAIQIIDTAATDEPNGVEIRVPVADVQSFRRTAEHFYSFWDPGTVLVDGVAPTCVWENTSNIQLDPDVVVMVGNTSYLVMGQVPYPVERDKLEFDNVAGSCLVLRMPIGSIDFTPNREALNYSKRTIEAVEAVDEFVQDRLYNHVIGKIDEAKTFREAWSRSVQWGKTTQRLFAKKYGYAKARQLRYKDLIVPDYLLAPGSQTFEMSLYTPYGYNESYDRAERIDSIPLGTLYSYECVIVGHTGTVVTANTKFKIRAWAEKNHLFNPNGRGQVYRRYGSDSTGIALSNDKVLLTSKLFGAPWFDETIIVVDYETDIKPMPDMPIPEKPIRAVREKTKYRMCGSTHQATKDVNELPDDCVAWIPATYDAMTRPEIRNYAQTWDGRVAIVLAVEQKRFKREHPHIPHFEDWWQKPYLDYFGKMNEWDKFTVNGGSDDKLRESGYFSAGEIPQFFLQWGLDSEKNYRSNIKTQQERIQLLMDPMLRELWDEWNVWRTGGGGHHNAQNIYRSAKRVEVALNNTVLMHNAVEIGPKLPLPFSLPMMARPTVVRDKLKAVKKKYPLLYHYEHYQCRNWYVMAEAMNAVYQMRNFLHIIPMAY